MEGSKKVGREKKVGGEQKSWLGVKKLEGRKKLVGRKKLKVSKEVLGELNSCIQAKKTENIYTAHLKTKTSKFNAKKISIKGKSSLQHEIEKK